MAVVLNIPNDPFNDLDDPFSLGHKNLGTELPDENQSISGLLHGLDPPNCVVLTLVV